jgi:Subtilase family
LPAAIQTTKSRSIRLVVRTPSKEAALIENVKEKIRNTLPIFQTPRVSKSLFTERQAEACAKSLTVRPLFPGAQGTPKQFCLRQYFVLKLTIPIGINGYDIAYLIRRGNKIIYECVYDEPIPRPPIKYLAVPAALPNPPSGGVVVPGGGAGVIPLSLNDTEEYALDRAWHLRRIKLPSNLVGGNGVKVGQVDTGSYPHPEADGIYVSVAQQGCTIDGENNPIDQLSSGVTEQPGHGVATASVLASRGTIVDATGNSSTLPEPGGAAGNAQVTGVARACTVVPVRSLSSVFLNVSNIDLAEGLWFCIQSNVDVVFMCFGGLYHPYLERAVSYAVYSNIIVVAAAGQAFGKVRLPFVTAPAAYPDAIAVTATAPSDQIWESAARGKAVDIAAPGSGVWVARVRPNGTLGASPGEGTSFATPQVAGAAALWLAAHGKANLLRRYAGQAKLAEVFRKLAMQTAWSPPGWDTGQDGAGILNIQDLLGQPLADVQGRDWVNYNPMTERELLEVLLGAPSKSEAEKAWEILLGTDWERLIGVFGQEVLDRIAQNFEQVENLVKDWQFGRVEDTVESLVDSGKELLETASKTLKDAVSWIF